MKIDINQVREFVNIEFLAKQLVEGFITGRHKSPYHGFSVEFAEHRLYNTGESTRHIDWKVYAKTDRLYTKKYEEETNLRCQIILDHSSSMFYPVKSKGKLKFSILSIAALAYLLQKQRDAVGLCSFSDKIELQTPIKSTGSHLNKIFQELEKLLGSDQKSKNTTVAPILHEIAEKNHRRSLIIIFSDMFEKVEDTDNLFKALQHLKHNKHEVLIFHVADHHTEINFEFEDRPYEFIDLESGEKLKVHPSHVKNDYVREVGEYFKKLKLRCGQLKIDLIEADIKDDFNTVLNAYLVKRARMS